MVEEYFKELDKMKEDGKINQEQYDNTMKLLEAMTPEQRAEWATAQGAPGILKLVELQGKALEKKFEELSLKQRQEFLDAMTEEWIKSNKDLFEDEKIAKVAEGLDLALLKEKGYKSYIEMSPSELKAHLEEVKNNLLEIIGKDGKEEDKEKQGEKDGKEEDKKRDFSLSDLTGGGNTSGIGGVTVETLMSKANESPFEFEDLASKLDDNQLYEIMKQTGV